MPPRFHNKGTLQKKEKRKHPSSSSSLTGKIPRAYEVWRPLRPRKDGRAGWGGGDGTWGGGGRGAGGETGQPASDERHGRQLKARMATLRRRSPHSPNNYCFCNAGNPPPPPLPPAIPPPPSLPPPPPTNLSGPEGAHVWPSD